MPGIRKACEDCRRQKLKCVWREDETEKCVRCNHKDQECRMPIRKAAPSSGQSQQRKDPAPTTAPNDDLHGRMRRLESLVSGLVPSSSRADLGARDESTRQPASLGALSREAYDYPELPTPPTRLVEICVAQIDKSAGRCFLPPPDDAVSLLQEFLRDFNSKIPLIHPERIIKHMRDCYSGAADQKPGPWVLTFTTFGIAHRMRAMSLFAMPGDPAAADYYMEKSLLSLSPLLLSDPSLLLVQCLLGVSILLQTSRSSHRAASFMAIAMRMVQDLGYNDGQANTQAADLGECSERRYAFWIAYFMNAEMDLAACRLGTMRLSEIAIPLPSIYCSDWWSDDSAQQHSNQYGSWQGNVFYLHSSLSLIQSKMVEELYSMKGRRRDVGDKCVLHQRIASGLSEWRQHVKIPAPSEISRCLHRSDITHLVMLEAAYFRTAFQLHASYALIGLDNNMDVFSCDAMVLLVDRLPTTLVGDARNLVELAALIPAKDVATSWANTRAMLAALFTLFSASTRAVSGNDAAYLSDPENQRLAAALQGLESAAEQAEDTVLASSVELLRIMYLQFR